jgi:hypothetical protein
MEQPIDKDPSLLTPEQILNLVDDQIEATIKNDKLCKGDLKALYDRYDFAGVIGEGGFGEV